MPQPVKIGRKERMSFSKINSVLDMPNLIAIQKDSYDWFIKEGLAEVFEDISPIRDYADNLALEFVDHSISSETKIWLQFRSCSNKNALHGFLSRS